MAHVTATLVQRERAGGMTFDNQYNADWAENAITVTAPLTSPLGERLQNGYRAMTWFAFDGADYLVYSLEVSV